jgi:subtilisin family serine protease
MHVAALASPAKRSHYSNYGTGILICAPTSNSHRFRRLTVRGLRITTTTGEAGSVTEAFGGTSSATPLVAGIAALTISANPELPAQEVVSILTQTASKDLSLEGYPRTPPAIFDPDPAWDVSPIEPFDRGDFGDTGDANGTWSPWFGHGKVDAQEAVTEALRRKRGPSA